MSVARANEPKLNRKFIVVGFGIQLLFQSLEDKFISSLFYIFPSSEAAAEAAASNAAVKRPRNGCVTVFVKNLPYDATEELLRAEFGC